MKSLKLITACVLVGAAVAGSSAAAGPRDRDVSRLRVATGGTARIVRDPATATARLIELKAGTVTLRGDTNFARAMDFLGQFGKALGLDDPVRDLEVVASTTDGLGMAHLEMRQVHHGVPVFGANLRMHFDTDGELVTVNGTIVPNLDVSSTPTLTGWEAAEVARTEVAKRRRLDPIALTISNPELVVFRAGLTRGVRGANHLAWRVEIGDGTTVRESLFVDAHDGAVVDRIDLIHTIRRTVYHHTTGDALWTEGDPYPFSGLDADKDVNVNTIIDAAADTYELFSNITAGAYLSYDGADATMRSIYEAASLECPNAAWNGATANFCASFSVDDVIAHEWVHGYTGFNHGLLYQWQPGALNESFSDIFGETVDLLNGRGLDVPSSPRAANGCSSFGGSGMESLFVTAPPSLAGIYDVGGATWNPEEWSVSGMVELADDATDTTSDGCEALVNFTAGRIALIDRGTCLFVDKARNAANAGAIALIVANQQDDSLVTMQGSDPQPTISGLFVGLTDGEALKSGVGDGLLVEMSGTPANDPSVRWLIGEDIEGSPIRDMWNPDCFVNAGRMSDPRYYCGEEDNGGVHLNSGVPNHAFALMVDGGTYNGLSIVGIGLTKAIHIYWRAMSVYQGPITDFAEHADLIEISCEDLIARPIRDLQTGAVSPDPIDAFDCEQVAKAMVAVEMREPPTQCNFEPILKPDPPNLSGLGIVFSENFDSDPGSAWTITSEGVYPEYRAADGEWRWTEDVPDGGDGGAFHAINSMLVGDCQPNSDDQSGVTRLESPNFVIPASAESATLAFDHYVATEEGWDGGNLKISVNGGDWQPVPTEAFAFNPYNATVIDTETIDDEEIVNTNPLAGEAAFTGVDEASFRGSWGQSQIDLGFVAVPGDGIRVRWDFGVDGCTGAEGWFLDNVLVVVGGRAPLAVRRSGGRRITP